ncbi:glycosyltransferase [Proteus terrae]|uniref:glycosyltransferase n=1 Tax=Proteus terrae TaxID=1574161 RepID=UPI0034E3DF4C
MKITKLVPPLSEKEIINEWIYTDITYVSIICCTYNQELYISDAINSFLSQKTKYKFEIIIHNDCSTDNTNDILISFKERYPNIIQIIKPKENLYSKYGINAPGLNAISQSLGKYIAFCEGDDFWIDKNKIQAQITTLENNSNINICFTAAKYFDANNGTIVGNKIAKTNKNIFTLSEVIKNGGDFIPTASILVKKETFNTIPKWFINAPVGDYFLQMYSAKEKGAIYLPLITTLYRVNSIGSWSSSKNQRSIEEIIEFQKRMNNSLNLMKIDGFNINDLNYAITNQETITTIQLIKNGHYSQAKNNIINSWINNPNINKMQRKLYYLRNIFSILHKLYLIKKILKDKMKFIYI